MSSTFEDVYAGAYDLLYEDKDYAGECDVLERMFSELGAVPISRVLDLGCGTGRHAVELARRGYDVVGVDRATHMLERARKRASAAGVDVTFLPGDVTTLQLDRRVEAALFLFAVLGYQTTTADVLAALRSARRHLERDGLVLFDVWYGPAVLTERPSLREKLVERDGIEVRRKSSGALDVLHHVCRVEFDVDVIAGGEVVRSTHETHLMRFFFPLEIEHLLTDADLELVRLAAFPEVEREPDETTWNVLAVARAV